MGPPHTDLLAPPKIIGDILNATEKNSAFGNPKLKWSVPTFKPLLFNVDYIVISVHHT